MGEAPDAEFVGAEWANHYGEGCDDQAQFLGTHAGIVCHRPDAFAGDATVCVTLWPRSVTFASPNPANRPAQAHPICGASTIATPNPRDRWMGAGWFQPATSRV